MPTATATPRVQSLSMQGIAIPAAVVDKKGFMARTRRHSQLEKTLSVTIQPAASGPSNTRDTITLRRSDILSEVNLRLVGTLTVNPGTGTAASTAKWPYGVFRNIGFNANGTSSLISARAWTLKAREMAKDEGLTDRGVTQTVAGSARSNGTLSLASESWGVGQNTTGLTSVTPAVELAVTIPVAEDGFDLSGAIFLQTSSAELSIVIDWAAITDVFALTGNATASFTGTLEVSTTKFDIPTENGAIIVPDLSMFHSLVETSAPVLSAGVDTETVVVGQGAGKYVLRVIQQLQNGAPNAPVPVTSANFGLMGWRYATSETPDQWFNGSHLRINNERQYSSDLGGVQGYAVHEFAKAGFRDLVDMGTTADLRLVNNINGNGVTLANGNLWYAVESVYRSGSGA
jgi:hypothetical protein